MSSFFLNYVFDYLLAPLESMIVLVDALGWSLSLYYVS